MHTITPHLTLATILAVRQFGQVRLIASAASAGRALGVIAVAAVVVVVAFVGAMVAAARRIAVLIAEFLQVAAAMTSYMFTVMIAVVLVTVVLVRH